jgi:hypothetical protein
MPSKKDQEIAEYLRKLSEQYASDDYLDEEEGDFDLDFTSTYMVVKVIPINRKTYDLFIKNQSINKSELNLFLNDKKCKTIFSSPVYDPSTVDFTLEVNGEIEVNFARYFANKYIKELNELIEGKYGDYLEIDIHKPKQFLVFEEVYSNVKFSGNFDDTGNGFDVGDFYIQMTDVKLDDHTIYFGYIPEYFNKNFEYSLNSKEKKISVRVSNSYGNKVKLL